MFRKRDPRFKTADRHKPKQAVEHFTPKDFIYDSGSLTCICPAGKRLYLKQRRVVIRGYPAVCFMGAKRDCGPCQLRSRCLKRSKSKYYTAGVFLWKSVGASPGNFHGQDETQDRFTYGSPHLQPAVGNSGAGLCQHLQHAGTEAIQFTRQDQSRRAVEAFLHCA